jgi:hypothetical protein
MSDRGASPAPAAAGSGGNHLAGEADLIERRLRTLGSICAVLAAAVLAAAGTIGWAAGRADTRDLMTSPPGDSFLIALGAMLLVLLASAVHRRILRPRLMAATEDDPGAPEAPADSAPSRPPAAARLRAYSWATGVTFGMLAAAAALGALAASAGKALLYGLVICLATLIAMAGWWPRRSGVDLALSGGSEPPDESGDRSGP